MKQSVLPIRSSSVCFGFDRHYIGIAVTANPDTGLSADKSRAIAAI